MTEQRIRLRAAGPASPAAHNREVHLLRPGPLYDADTGKLRLEVTADLLDDLLRVFERRRAEGGQIPVDWAHGSGDDTLAPELQSAVGQVEAMRVDPRLGLVGRLVYTDRGRSLVEDHRLDLGDETESSALYISPELVIRDVFARGTGERIGGAEILAISLTPRPAQNSMNCVLLSRCCRLQRDDESVTEEVSTMPDPQKIIAACESCIAACKACVAEAESVANPDSLVAACEACILACEALIGAGGDPESPAVKMCIAACKACAAVCRTMDNPTCETCATECDKCIAACSGSEELAEDGEEPEADEMSIEELKAENEALREQIAQLKASQDLADDRETMSRRPPNAGVRAPTPAAPRPTPTPAPTRAPQVAAPAHVQASRGPDPEIIRLKAEVDRLTAHKHVATQFMAAAQRREADLKLERELDNYEAAGLYAPGAPGDDGAPGLRRTYMFKLAQADRGLFDMEIERLRANPEGPDTMVYGHGGGGGAIGAPKSYEDRLYDEVLRLAAERKIDTSKIQSGEFLALQREAEKKLKGVRR
ncbi:MAG: hypothetical protein Q8Q14_00560 [Gemmatimonadales bacterium]|nr:hypothetical protein [Gemmatimonadales bacterium]